MCKTWLNKWNWIGLGALLLFAACGEDEPSPRAPTSVPPTAADMAAARAPVDMAMAPAPMPPAPAPTAPPATSAAVTVMDNFYTPPNVTISAGGTVTWTWAGANSHTVTSNTGAFDSSPPKTSGTFSFTFPTAGTFPYHCLVHGLVMSGTVTVQ
jgi:plastocyanin